MSVIGKILAHYEITSQLGKGRMGEVYQPKDRKLGRDVAIKALPEEFAKDADRVARFQREAKLLASLNHTNIAAIYAPSLLPGLSVISSILNENSRPSGRKSDMANVRIRYLRPPPRSCSRLKQS